MPLLIAQGTDLRPNGVKIEQKAKKNSKEETILNFWRDKEMRVVTTTYGNSKRRVRSQMLYTTRPSASGAARFVRPSGKALRCGRMMLNNIISNHLQQNSFFGLDRQNSPRGACRAGFKRWRVIRIFLQIAKKSVFI